MLPSFHTTVVAVASIVLLVVAVATQSTSVNAFSPLKISSSSSSRHAGMGIPSSSSGSRIDTSVVIVGDRIPTLHRGPTKLSMIGDLLSGLMGNDKSNGSNGSSNVIIDIPAKAVKVGPIKFYLQIYLVGEQNTPTKGSWFLRQNDETQTLDMYFGDGTAMLSINVQENGIKIERNGQRPSLQYMLQESVLLHGVLDELETLAFGVGESDDNEDGEGTESIAPEKRLLQFDDDQTDVLSKARDVLPARKED